MNLLSPFFFMYTYSVRSSLLLKQNANKYISYYYTDKRLFQENPLPIMQIYNKINNFLESVKRKPPTNDSDSQQAHVLKPAEESEGVAPTQIQYPQDRNIIHCPTSMALFFILTVEALVVTAMEGCIIYYHTLIFARCNLSLRTLGLSQVDLVYHGIFVMSFIYQVFLYMDSLRQRNVFQLMILLLYGKLFL